MTPAPSSASLHGSSRPRISILMAVYNAERYLSEAIRSVIAQTTAQAWELLIVDDGSADASFSIAQDLASKHPHRISLLQHAGGINRGISASRNLALKHARGELLAFLDADDVMLPEHLSVLSAALDQHPTAAMVYAAAERWVHYDSACDPVRARASTWGDNFLPPLLPPGQQPGLISPGTLLPWFLEDESLVPCICALMVRRSAALAVGGFEEEFRGLFDDQVFHAKISDRFPIFALDECVARYRQHAKSCCATSREGTLTHTVAAHQFRLWLCDQN